MNKKNLFIIGAMMFSTLLFSQNTVSIKEYFPHTQGMQWFYEYLKPTKKGQLRQSFRECQETDTIDGELSTMIRTIIYLGTMKTEVIHIYAIVDNAILVTLTKGGMGGVQQHFDRPVQVKLPINNQKPTWERKEDGGFICKSVAEIIPSLKTKLGEFTDVIKVTEKVYENGVLYVTECRFYAKNYGLIKVETYNKSGKLVDMVTYQLVELKK